MADAKKQRKPARPSFLQENLGVLCLVVCGAVLLAHWLLGSRATLAGIAASAFLFPSHAYVATAEDARSLRSSDGRSVTAGQVLYTSGSQDVAFVVFYMLVITALRQLVTMFIFLPLARLVRVRDVMQRHKFAESAWQFIWYLGAWLVGFSIQYGSSWWFGGATMLGGPDDWTVHLWAGYPFMYHTLSMKLYYLLQAAFWTSMIFVTLVEPWRSDTLFMIIHHLITSWLVTTSYWFNQVRIGTAILVEQDFADIFLPLAKSFRYLGYTNLGTLFFALFALAWYPTRHYIFFFLWGSIYYDYPVVLQERWDPANNYYVHAAIRPVYFGLLGLLQLLLLRWGFVDLTRAIYKALTDKEVDDHRSGEEEEDATEDKAARGKGSKSKKE